jgi:hypothetical protein
MHQCRSTMQSRSAARHGAAAHRRLSRAALPAFGGLVLALSTFAAGAIGPILPLEFREMDRAVELVVDPTRIGKVDARMILYDHGRPVREQTLGLRLEERPDGAAAARVPIQLERFSDLQPGYYALKLVAVGAPSDPERGAVPLQVERWVHIEVDKSGVRRVSDEEYSDAVDPVELGRDDLNRQILVHGGSGREAPVSLEDTDRGQDTSLGRTGAAIEELTPQGDQAETALRRDESRER